MRPLLGGGDSAAARLGFPGTGRKGRPVRARKRPRGAREAGAIVLALGLAWCCASCSPAARRLPSSRGLESAPWSTPRAAGDVARITESGGHRVAPAASARQLWASALPGGTAVTEALSPDGTRRFVLGYVGPAVKSETVSYSTAT